MFRYMGNSKLFKMISFSLIFLLVMNAFIFQLPINAEAATDSSTLLYNDFENGLGFSGGAGTTVTIDNTESANANESQSIKMTVKSDNSGWPDVQGNYVDVTTETGTYVDASAYSYIIFYVKDMVGSNGIEMTITSQDGKSYKSWIGDIGGTEKSNGGKWTKMIAPLKPFSDNGVDLTKIIKLRLGEYNSGIYYFDDIYFAQTPDDELPNFKATVSKLDPKWFQNFEYENGFAPSKTTKVELEKGDSATPYGFNCVKLTMSDKQGGDWDNDLNSVIITPQFLSDSLTPNDPYDYQYYMDVSNFNFLIFYVKDTSNAGNNVHVTFTDINGKSWDTDTGSQKTVKNQWVKMSVALDTTKDIDFTKIKEIRLGMYWDYSNVYYFDDLYFAQNATDNPPNWGYTTLNLKTINNEIVPYENGIPLGSFEKQKSRKVIDLSGSWKSQRVSLDPQKSIAIRDTNGIKAIEDEADGRYTASYDDSAWSSKILPSPENEMRSAESKTGPEEYQGGVWYRKHFTVDSSMQGKNVLLSFLGVNYFTDVWINGHYIGWHQGGYTPFAFDVSNVLNYGADNVIAVRVDNPQWSTTFQNGEILPYTTSDWFNYTGILRPCYLEVTDNTYIVRSDVKTVNTDGTIEVRTVVNDKTQATESVELSYQIYNTDIKTSNQTSEYAEDIVGTATNVEKSTLVNLNSNSPVFVDKFEAKIDNPKLWTPSTPNLYVLKVTAKVNGEIVDTYYTQFGLRILSTDGDKILLNGNLAPFLVGVGRTEDDPVKGPSMNDEEQYRDFQVIKNTLNANFVRTGHFPANKTSYIYTDRLGIAVWQEIPVYWFSGDAFTTQINRGIARQIFEEMIYSNYNRPSVWFDGTCNESGGQLSRVNYIADLKNIAMIIDGTRLIGQSAAGSDATDDSHRSADVIGMTMYDGVFYGSNAYNDTIDTLTKMHNKFPDKPIIVTEYGYWSSDDDSTAMKQYEIFNSTFNAFAKLSNVKEDGTPNQDGFLSGAAWWCAFDWYTEITKTQTMGLLHMDRLTPKLLTSIFAERYNRYTHTSSDLTASGISAWYNCLNSANGIEPGADATVQVVTTDGSSGNIQAAKLVATKPNYLVVSPQGGALVAPNIADYNYLNFYVKDMNGSNNITITFSDSNGKTWSAVTPDKTQEGQWTKLSLPIGANVSNINTAAVNKITFNVPVAGTYYFSSIYFSTYITDAAPEIMPVGKSVWYQNFENVSNLEAGTGATAEVSTNISLTGTKSAKLITSGSGDPGNSSYCVVVKPSEAETVDITPYGYVSFYVLDTQGSNTVHLTFTDVNGKQMGLWSDISSIKGSWTKIYASLASLKGSNLDLTKIKSIALGEWNKGTYYFDDIYLAQYSSDGPPVSGTTQKPASIQLTLSDVKLNVGETKTVNATVYDQNNNAMPNINVSWSSSDPTVATVDNTGKITAIAAGTTVVKATYGDLSASVDVTVASQNNNGSNPLSSGGSGSGGNGNNGTTQASGIGTITTSGNTTVLTLDENKVIDQIKNTTASNVTFDISTIGQTQRKAIEIPVSVITTAKDASKEIIIKSSNAEITMPKNSLDLTNVSGNVTVTIEDKGKENITGYKLLSNVTDISITTGNNKINILEPVKVTINISNANDIRKVGVYYYNETTGNWEYVGGRADKNNNTITFDAKHFSQYAALEYDKTFNDIKTHWAKDAIEVLASKHIVSGIDDNNFAPDNSITRAEFASMMIRLLGISESPYQGEFTDVKTGDWYANAIEAAYKAGIILGDGNTMRPNDKITREEMAAIAMRVYSKLTTYNEEDINKTSFSDDSQISDWAKAVVANASKLGIIQGEPNNLFVPNGNATRAEATTVIYRIMDKSGDL
ncbi:Ig-like protein group 2 [Thermohydrogenium kirishiense]|nr:Ig-like protein group 2 [Thermohydrogenium kirishiense]